MAHLKYLNRSDLAEQDRYLLESEINVDRIMAHSLPAARIMHELGDWIRFRSSMDPRLREMVILQVGYIAQDAYETSHHVKIGHDFGVSEVDLQAIVQETKGEVSRLSELDRTVLRATREVFTKKSMSADTLEFLKNRFSETWIVEFVVIVGFYQMLNTFIACLDVDVEDSWAEHLKKMPLGIAGAV